MSVVADKPNDGIMFNEDDKVNESITAVDTGEENLENESEESPYILEEEKGRIYIENKPERIKTHYEVTETSEMAKERQESDSELVEEPAPVLKNSSLTSEVLSDDADTEDEIFILKPSMSNGCVGKSGTMEAQDVTTYKPLTNSEVKEVNTYKPLQAKSTWKLPNTCRGCSLPFSPLLRQMANVVVACLAGVVLGTIHAYPAVSLPRWEETGFVLTTAQSTLFASTPMVVSLIICWGSGIVVETLGNRKTLMFGVPVMGLSWIIIAIANEFWMLMLGRVLQGLVASVYMVIITVYPAEVSVVRWRGVMTGISEAMVMLGAFLTYLSGLILQPYAMAITMAISLIPMVICIYFLKDSPVWMARQDKNEETAAILRSLRGPDVDISAELDQIVTSVATEKVQKPTSTEQLLLLRKRIYLKPLVLSVSVLFFKELTGQYAAMAYSVKIFKMAGSSLDPYWCAVVMGAARFLPCFISWFFIERLPRRLLICSCMTLASSALAALGAFLWFWSRKEGGVPDSLGWIPLACLLAFTLTFGVGVGPTCWTLVAELLPSQVRNVGAGIINTSFSLFLFLVSLTFPFMIDAIGIGPTFITYSAFSLMGVVFVIFCLPETKGRSFSEIQSVLQGEKTVDSNTI